MELMWLVYAVETLTYNGSFFVSLANFVIAAGIVWVILKLIADHALPETKESTVVREFTDSLNDGEIFKLSCNYSNLIAGKIYTVRRKWSTLNQVNLEGKRSSHDYNLAEIQKRCVVGTEIEVIPAYKHKVPQPKYKLVIGLFIVFTVLNTILPSRDTAIKMAGAYLIQTVVTSEKANNLGDAAYRATLRQLEKWAAEVPELNDMVQDMNNELKVEEVK